MSSIVYVGRQAAEEVEEEEEGGTLQGACHCRMSAHTTVTRSPHLHSPTPSPLQPGNQKHNTAVHMRRTKQSLPNDVYRIAARQILG